MRPQTPDILQQIIQRKREEVASRQQAMPLPQLQQELAKAPPVRNFTAALQQRVAVGQAAVIAEIKRASPSKGVIRADFDPAAIAHSYQQGGAACLSVLTDIDFFQGCDDYLRQARAACSLPVLRKDFTIDRYQIVEARSLGADCILLIAACLDDQELADLYQQTQELGMEALIEVHDASEMERALALGGGLLGVNNRNLHTFAVDLETTLQLRPLVPEGRLLVTESGILGRNDVARMQAHAIHAFLVGEAFMRASDPGAELARLFA